MLSLHAFPSQDNVLVRKMDVRMTQLHISQKIKLSSVLMPVLLPGNIIYDDDSL